MSVLSIRPKLQLSVDLKRKLFIQIDKIIMLEADGNYTIIHLLDEESWVFARCINSYEDELSKHGFLRIHKSYLINPTYVVSYISKDKMILMENNLNAPLSRRKKSMVRVSSIRRIVGKYAKYKSNL